MLQIKDCYRLGVAADWRLLQIGVNADKRLLQIGSYRFLNLSLSASSVSTDQSVSPASVFELWTSAIVLWPIGLMSGVV